MGARKKSVLKVSIYPLNFEFFFETRNIQGGIKKGGINISKFGGGIIKGGIKFLGVA